MGVDPEHDSEDMAMLTAPEDAGHGSGDTAVLTAPLDADSCTTLTEPWYKISWSDIMVV